MNGFWLEYMDNASEKDGAGPGAGALHVACMLSEALPGLPAPHLVDLLDFVHVQHSGSCFSADNTGRADAIVAFLSERPFAVTEAGVDALVRLARHALVRSEALAGGRATSAEHQLWLLASSALNTAAAVRATGAAEEPAATFARVERGGAARVRYLQHHYAIAAMRDHAEWCPQPGPAASGTGVATAAAASGGRRAAASLGVLVSAAAALGAACLVAAWMLAREDGGIGAAPVPVDLIEGAGDFGVERG